MSIAVAAVVIRAGLEAEKRLCLLREPLPEWPQFIGRVDQPLHFVRSEFESRGILAPVIAVEQHLREQAYADKRSICCENELYNKACAVLIDDRVIRAQLCFRVER